MQWQVDKDEAGTAIPPDTQLQDASVVRRVVEISPEIGQRLAELAVIAEATSQGIAKKQLLPGESADNDQVELQPNSNRTT